jgi:hypothetical protein
MLKRILRRQDPPEDAHDVMQEFPEAFVDMPEAVPDETAVAERIPMQTIVRWRRLIGIGLVIAAIVLLAGNVSGAIPPDLLDRWPWVLIVGGALWLLVGLVTGWAHGTLGGPLVASIGLVALLGQQEVVLNLMLVSGAVLVALGLGVIVRGVTMPRT